MSLSKYTDRTSKIFFSTKQIIFRVIFFSTFRKITVGGFVNQLIKKFWPYFSAVAMISTQEYNSHCIGDIQTKCMSQLVKTK